MTDPATVFSWQLIYHLVNLGVFSSAAGTCISPFSLYLALVLVLNGAGPFSSTHSQLWGVLNRSQPAANVSTLHLPRTEPEFNKIAAAIVTDLLAQSSSDGTRVNIANGVWALNRPIKKGYTDRIWQLYKAQVQTVGTTDPINSWTRNRTAGRISEAVPTGARFHILVTNAVYFRAKWQYPFDPQDTQLHPFQTMLNGTKRAVQVPMMYRSFRSYDITGSRQIMYGNLTSYFRAVKLPYRGSNMSAVALLPDQKRYGLDVDAAVMDLAEMQLLSRMRWRTVYQVGRLQLQMPKFKVQSKQVPVKQALRALNVTAPFSKARANFSRITDEPMFITDILQSTLIEVDESGTEAAAVTSTVMLTMSYNPGVQQLVFDRPFIFLVMDDETNMPLFQATIKDPTLAV